MYQLLYVLAIVFATAAVGWAWFRRRANSLVSDLEGQITLLKIRVGDLEQQLATLRNELREKRILEG